MKHRKGIDLLAGIPPESYYAYEPSPSVYRSLDGILEWEMLGARCGKCAHVAWLDTKALRRRVGNDYLRNLQHRLVCRCGNAHDNRLLIGKVGRH